MKKLAKRSERGFTLIELLVVVGIIGILAAIAMPQLGGYRRRGYDADVKSGIKNFTTAQEAYFVETNSYGSGSGNDVKFTSRGFRQSTNVNISTVGNAANFTVTGTAVLGCITGTGVWTFDSSTAVVFGFDCS